MRICHFDNDRLGLVTNGFVHDATHIQEQIRAAAPYAMKGHEVIEALPEWRDRLIAAAAEGERDLADRREAPRVGGAPVEVDGGAQLCGPHRRTGASERGKRIKAHCQDSSAHVSLSSKLPSGILPPPGIERSSCPGAFSSTMMCQCVPGVLYNWVSSFAIVSFGMA